MKNKIIILVILVILILQISMVLGIGVTPGRKTINFEPNFNTNVQFSIINNEKKLMSALIYVEGELNSSVTIQQSLVEFLPSEESKSFSYNVLLPNSLNEPGIHEARIVVRELPVQGSSTVGATPTVISQLYVMVPYPGKYLKSRLNVLDVDGIKPLKFFVSLESLGEQNIANAQSIIDIYGSNNEKVTTLTTNSIALNSKQKNDLIVQLDNKRLNPGKYYAKSTVTYDGKTSESELVFSYGQMILDVLGIEVNNFKLGGIAKFDILVENKFGEELKNVYAELALTNQKGEEVTRFKSSSENIQKNSKIILSAFWDTAGFKEGNYNGKLAVYYGDKLTEKPLRAVVTLNSIKTEFIGINAEAVAVTSGGNVGILLLFIVILIAINIGWFFYFKKKR